MHPERIHRVLDNVGKEAGHQAPRQCVVAHVVARHLPGTVPVPGLDPSRQRTPGDSPPHNVPPQHLGYGHRTAAARRTRRCGRRGRDVRLRRCSRCQAAAEHRRAAAGRSAVAATQAPQQQQPLRPPMPVAPPVAPQPQQDFGRLASLLAKLQQPQCSHADHLPPPQLQPQSAAVSAQALLKLLERASGRRVCVGNRSSNNPLRPVPLAMGQRK